MSLAGLTTKENVELALTAIGIGVTVAAFLTRRLLKRRRHVTLSDDAPGLLTYREVPDELVSSTSNPSLSQGGGGEHLSASGSAYQPLAASAV